MSYSYARLDEAWNQSRPNHGHKTQHSRTTSSSSPSPSPSPSSNDTIVINDDMYRSASPSMESFYTDTTTDNRSASLSPSLSPSPDLSTPAINTRFNGIITSGRGSPVASLDEDDFDPSTLNSGIFTKSQKSNENVTFPNVTGGKGEEKLMRQILRIQDDVREMLRNERSGSGNDRNDTRFPFVETGLFISVGLFVLLAMNLMLRMGKQHVTYRFNFAD